MNNVEKCFLIKKMIKDADRSEKIALFHDDNFWIKIMFIAIVGTLIFTLAFKAIQPPRLSNGKIINEEVPIDPVYR